MGDKIESKKAAAKADVSTVPATFGVITDEKHAVKIADGIGYPCHDKSLRRAAAARGCGLRIRPRKSRKALVLAKAGSPKASSGDDRVLSRSSSSIPATSKIQVLGDKPWQRDYLGEQRNVRSSAAIRR